MCGQVLPPNQWVELRKDSKGARRGSAFRYAEGAKKFVLWGFMNHDPVSAAGISPMEIPEYDVVALIWPCAAGSIDCLPRWRAEWSRKLPLDSPLRNSGITTEAERTILRGAAEGTARSPAPRSATWCSTRS